MPSALERRLRVLTAAIDGQYPRPWTTECQMPEAARVYIVGLNQATSVPAADMSHDAFIDSLWNRNGRSCRALYDSLRPRPSLTRTNIDRLTLALRTVGIVDVLQTNVVCYSTPMSRDLRASGRTRGREIFRAVLDLGSARLLIVHGAATARELGRGLDTELPTAPSQPHAPLLTRATRNGRAFAICVIPSLAPPAWNRWQSWAGKHFEQLAAACAQLLAT